ncbi:MAG: hypothetical protein ABSG70_03220 [Terriglobales bacterium]|jgi:uncharacterized membrane protein (DUF106 family)
MAMAAHAARVAFGFALFLPAWLVSPLSIVIIVSVVVGLLMIVLFGYTSDQKAIGIAKDQLKAHLLAVRLYRDQLQVVMGSYGKILRGTGRYLRLAFKPLLYVIIPITLLIVQLDRYLGLTAIQTNTPFLVTVRVNKPEALDGISIDLPPGITASAPAVHVAADNEVVWRLAANQEGSYEVKILADGQSVAKTVRVSSQLARVSPERWRDHFWQRVFSSGESALPDNSAVESILVDYPERNIPLGVAGYEMNWIWLFFILSMIAGFIFKELLGIQV